MSKKNKRQVTKASSAPMRTATSPSESFHPDYSDVKKDLRRIGILAGSFVSILIVLAFFLR